VRVQAAGGTVTTVSHDMRADRLGSGRYGTPVRPAGKFHESDSLPNRGALFKSHITSGHVMRGLRIEVTYPLGSFRWQ